MSHLKLVTESEELVAEIEASVRSHPAGKGLPDREWALRDVEVWANRLDVAREAYAEAVLECEELGIPRHEIAARAGRSESAIRMFLKRKANRRE